VCYKIRLINLESTHGSREICTSCCDNTHVRCSTQKRCTQRKPTTPVLLLGSSARHEIEWRLAL